MEPSRLTVGQFAVWLLIGAVFVTFLILQHDSDQQRLTDMCREETVDRQALLDLTNFATEPSAVDTSRIESGELRTQIEIENQRAKSFRDYANTRLAQSPDCGGS